MDEEHEEAAMMRLVCCCPRELNDICMSRRAEPFVEQRGTRGRVGRPLPQRRGGGGGAEGGGVGAEE